MFNQEFQNQFKLNSKLAIALAIITLASILFGLIATTWTNLILDSRIATAREAERPAEISIIEIKEPSCLDCFDLTPIIDAIKKESVNIVSQRIVELASVEGAELVKKYNITKVPSLIVSGEINKNAKLKLIWPQAGDIVDNIFVMRQVVAPYVLTDSGEVRGRMQWVMLTDTACDDCYDVTLHEDILKRYGLPTENQKIIGRQLSEGQELIAKYDITLLPTIILTGDVDDYPSLTKIWSQVGTIESDGAYVFREGVKQMGTYRDLNTGQVIKPSTDSGDSQN
ncbi:MAG TPA: hypothetical protein VJB67_02265 [Patescibacteria group bacterium]|nr:hypothetical protein [Patescibacteria group bacterium]